MASAGVSVGTGIAVGLALSLGLNHVVSAWVGIRTNHPVIVLSVSLLLLVVAGMACLVPARKAISIDPKAALGPNDFSSDFLRDLCIVAAGDGAGTPNCRKHCAKLCEFCVDPIASSSRAAVSYTRLTEAGFDSSRLGLGASSTPHGSRNHWFLRMLGEVDSAVVRRLERS
jgi:hypothetical protein